MDLQLTGTGAVTVVAGSSTGLMVWWMILGAIGVLNVCVWTFLAVRFGRGGSPVDPGGTAARRRQLWLSAAFAFGCAFRSILPRAEVQRICLHDSWISSATIGRAVATVAELCFVAQWTLLLREAFRGSGASFGAIVSRLTLPLIAIAEVFSWYATLTTNFIGSVVEESLWATTSALMTLSFVRLWWRSSLGRRRLVRVAFALNVAYVAFMLMVDIPMYLSRWRADQAAGRAYLSVAEGWTDALHRRVITRRWEDWWQEMPWMSLYFSAGVWLSMALVRAPALGDRRPPTVRT